MQQQVDGGQWRLRDTATAANEAKEERDKDQEKEYDEKEVRSGAAEMTIKISTS